MNSKLYKQVHQLAEGLLKAAQSDSEVQFNELYEQLKTLCEENEGDDHKNHPVQWETLGDFTEDVEQALNYYAKALDLANMLNNYEYITSVYYAMANLLHQAGRNEEALPLANQAKQAMTRVNDNELEREVVKLCKALV